MIDIIVQHIGLGFGLSMIVFFYGQGVRCLMEVVEHTAK